MGRRKFCCFSLPLGVAVCTMATDVLHQDNQHDESPLWEMDSIHSRTGTVNSAFETEVEDMCNREGEVVTSLADDIAASQRTLYSYKWNLNYQEAAIFLQEGENNDKYDTHPTSYEALPTYHVAHNKWFYMLDLSASIILLSLAICERPAAKGMALPVGIHSSLELFCLLILTMSLGIRLKWLKGKTFFKHKRTAIKSFVLFIMIIEAITVICRQQNHFRVTRALRPLFLMDSYYCKGVRRFTRQILQSLRPIFDMLVLLLFFMLIFSILGFYLFSDIKGYTYFHTIQDSFVSLFVLMTTANYPDVMMPAYNESRYYAAFFIIYLSLELFFLMNLLLAVVYDTFSSLEKEKVRKLFFHKRTGCQHAFRLLVSKSKPMYIELKHFMGMMKYYRPNKSRKDVYLLFKGMNICKTGFLNLEEFISIYQYCKLKWRIKNDDIIWSSDFRPPFNIFFRGLYKLVTHKCFEYYIYLTIAANFVWILIDTVHLSVQNMNVKKYNFPATGATIFFLYMYVMEACLKILGKGPKEYFTTGWDLFDFIVTLVSITGVLGELVNDSFYYIMVLRPFRLLRLFKIKRRYRDVLGTFFVIFSRLVSISITIMMLYYCFAIIGMEMFGHVNLTNCCKNSSVEDFYRSDNSTNLQGLYYLNNFHNIFNSGVTLFELTVVNNWFIIMEGYAVHVSEWTRAFFMMFYIVSMVVMNIVVAFVLDAFIFRIQYRRAMKLDNIDDHGMQQIDVGLTEDEFFMCEHNDAPLLGSYIPESANSQNFRVVYRGERRKNREDFSLQMYKEEVKDWIEQERTERLSVINHMEELCIRQRPNTNILP